MTAYARIALKNGKTIEVATEPIIEGVFLRIEQKNGYDLIPSSQVMAVKVMQESKEDKKIEKKIDKEPVEEEEEW